MTLILATPNNPGVAEWIDASLIAGGCTVIENGGTLSGEYTCSVVCLGDVSMAADVEILSNLFVAGSLTNDSGYDLMVRGDFHGHGVDWTRTITTLPQGELQVDGDFFFTQIAFPQYAATTSTLRVGGNLIGTTDPGSQIGAAGFNGTSGAQIIVHGDLITGILVANSNFNENTAGAGGSVTVYGDLKVWGGFLDLTGGPCLNGPAGNGGLLVVYGDIVVAGAIVLGGGSCSNGNGGNGGSIEGKGNLTAQEISFTGGLCVSNDSTHRSGSAGLIFLYGSLTCSGFINGNGGDREGVLLAAGTESPPNAGTIEVQGALTANSIDLNGGRVETEGFAPHAGGNGGTLNVDGPLTLTEDLEMYGGYSVSGDGGAGGNLLLQADALIDDDFEINGGYSNNGNGGIAGDVFVRGNLSFADGRWWGGDAINGNGGDGPSVTVEGSVYCQYYISGNGGSCFSTNEIHSAGSGGSLTIRSDLFYGDDGDLSLGGGIRSGATTVANLAAGAPNGGNLEVNGNVTSLSGINLVGGSVVTDYPNAPGGSGGSINIRGSFSGFDILLYAGSSIGNNGGTGGNFECRGPARFDTLSVAGGPSYDSVVGPDAQNEGSSGSVTLFSGGVGNTILMSDGGNGTPATASVRLAFNGTLTVYAVNMTDRVDSWIVAYNAPIPAVLKVNAMAFKQTLNNDVGTPTSNISANLADSIFMTGTSSTWYAIAGVAI
jgi:hypothetical protein